MYDKKYVLVFICNILNSCQFLIKFEFYLQFL